MTELTKAEDLMLVAADQGIKLDAEAAGVVLSYMEGHDYLLMVDQNGQTMGTSTTEQRSLYDALSGSLKMSDAEILAAGFTTLKGFMAGGGDDEE